MTRTIAFALALMLLPLTAQAHGKEDHANHAAVAPTSAPEPIANLAKIKDKFTLVNQDGKTVTEKSWPGKFKLVFFGFTTCPDMCPAALEKLSAALKKLGPKAEKVQVLFITTDPETDTPKVIKAYLHPQYKTVEGLTGTAKQIHAAEASYKVFASKTAAGVDHSLYIYLMSPEGQLLQMFGNEEPAEKIAATTQAFIDAAPAKKE